jgi:competence protein ComEA
LAILSLGALALFLVAGGVVLLLRHDDNAPIQVLPPGAAAISPGVASGVPAGTGLRVYVNGAVQRPGVYSLQPGDRVEEALAAAGGPLPQADLAAVNRACRVRDEGYYYVPRLGESPPPLTQAWCASSPAVAVGIGAAVPLLDINTAPASALESLPGIGPELAGRIVEHRTQTGPFQSPADIMNVRGIGPGIYQQVQPLITAGTGAAAGAAP